MEIKELITNEAVLNSAKALVISGVVYTGIKVIEKKIEKNHNQKEMYKQMKKKEEDRINKEKENKRIKSYFNTTRPSFEGLNRDEWLINGSVKKLSLTFMNLANTNAKEKGAIYE